MLEKRRQGQIERVGIMSLAGLQLFQRIEQKMDWLVARQSVLAENVANADTPDYKAKDLKPFSFQKHLENADALAMATSHAGHIPFGGKASVVPVLDGEVAVAEIAPDGNQVSLEEQMMKIADTGLDYQTLTNLYTKQLGMFKTALGRGGSNA